MNNFNIGDIVTGTVTGIENYGVFVSLGENSSGLIHISEISDFFVRNVNDYVELNETIKVVRKNMDRYDFNNVGAILYSFIWDDFCDWYIELAKYRIWHADEDEKGANAALWTLKNVLANGLKMLHPFMPFVSEEIYSALVPEEEFSRYSSGVSYDLYVISQLGMMIFFLPPTFIPISASARPAWIVFSKVVSTLGP